MGSCCCRPAPAWHECDVTIVDVNGVPLTSATVEAEWGVWRLAVHVLNVLEDSKRQGFVRAGLLDICGACSTVFADHPDWLKKEERDAIVDTIRRGRDGTFSRVNVLAPGPKARGRKYLMRLVQLFTLIDATEICAELGDAAADASAAPLAASPQPVKLGARLSNSHRLGWSAARKSVRVAATSDGASPARHKLVLAYKLVEQELISKTSMSAADDVGEAPDRRKARRNVGKGVDDRDVLVAAWAYHQSIQRGVRPSFGAEDDTRVAADSDHV